MTVQEFYQGMGRANDFDCRSKIEKAVMQNHTIHWNDELTYDVAMHIVNANKEKKG